MTRCVPIRLLSAALAATMLAGCGGGHRDGGDVTEDVPALEAQLRAKPPFEDAQRDYEAALSQTADAIAAMVPGMTWHFEENSWRGCTGELVQTRGVHVYLLIVMTGTIRDDRWPMALQTLKTTAARFGATEPAVLFDKPGDRDVFIKGSDGVEFQLGTKVDTILTAKSDCRMRQNER
jgi:Lipoprotein confined to pathogenic Mycobacterium